MYVTEEQLNQMVGKAVKEELSTMVNKPKRPREWAKLSQEIENHLAHFGNPTSGQLKDAINTILRHRLGVKNVYQINETNIDDAREVVNELKKII